MIFSANLPKSFWGEAMNTTAYLINRCPSSAINFKNPVEHWSGQPADYSGLRIFGCLAYAHVKQDKLDARARRCVFIGYPEGIKGYKVWSLEPTGTKCFVTRDVTFDESKMGYKMANIKESASEPQVEVELGSESTSQGTNDHEINDENVERESQLKQEPGSYTLARDRQRRVIRPPQKFGQADMVYYALTIAEQIDYQEPTSYKEALAGNDSCKWIEAMNEELESLNKNQTSVLVSKPKNHRVVGCKWIFKVKEGASEADNPRYKASLVAKGYSQQERIDFNEIYSPVVKHTSIRMILALVAHYDLELEQLDVKTALLHGELEETIYMSQTEGLITTSRKDMVCLLKKSSTV